MLDAAGAAGATVPINVLKGGAQGQLESQVLQQGFQAAGLKSSINVQDTNTWLDALYTNRTHEGISNNYGTLPFPWIQIGNYLFTPIGPAATGHGKVGPALPDLWNVYDKTTKTVAEGPYAAGLKRMQRLMLDEAAIYNTFVAFNSQIVPKNLQGLQATRLGDVFFDHAYLA